MKTITIIFAVILMTACGASMPQRHSYLKAAAGIDQQYVLAAKKVNYSDDEATITVVAGRP